jgi:hypothetical protein
MIVTSRPNIRCDISHSQPPNLKILKMCFFLCFFLIVSNFLPSYTIGNETAMLIRCSLLPYIHHFRAGQTTVYRICALADAAILVPRLHRFAAASSYLCTKCRNPLQGKGTSVQPRAAGAHDPSEVVFLPIYVQMSGWNLINTMRTLPVGIAMLKETEGISAWNM